ncbi:MAG: 7-cyano-7-deazaguanine synthase QueC [Candidatus Jordarchaeaceae archaeon]
MVKIAVVLLSGGLDSTTTAAYAKSLGYEVHAITVNYGQRLGKEVKCAERVAEKLGITHRVVNFSQFSEVAWYSALTTPDLFALPEGRSVEKMREDIPVTYVPMRNTFFIVLAAAYLESEVLYKIEKDEIKPKEIEAKIFIAANALDYSGYPDCRPEFYEKINELMKVASKVGTKYNLEMKIEAPLLYKGKKEIVELGTELNAPLEWTWSCYEGGEIPCGKCDSCLLRAKGFSEAGIEDPLIKRLKKEGKM